ncbi:amino acid ABC transporter substrate-binding protein, PAAT family (TC 3.A.1.3.-) [Roseibium hamelinense]|uniref:Amino acid ABC transporter substrate-binding protein, PAAT family (TC 3.A.1.3.-) n=1 Tax=Roseibium hamelinense TaxID=150831 RepID=A0A562SUH7_9HYPH|nr:transporter substrate-binding domain-containing protein [Roseibium hamelinense]MTI42734.1 transporter substrate-binding domain-containing protein [Roseibium hamelinense]TWI84614.1 amino acid ABC transporter substrate-binding protein, PAAT family (TC 3.A.1.3.-) [Roseibium hamelinense]
MVYLNKYAILIILACLVPTHSSASEAPNFWDLKSGYARPVQIPDTIQFLATDGYPPFVFRDAEGRLTGFNVDLARRLCQELEISCSLRIKDFDELLTGLREEEGDAIMAGLARSAELAEDVVFSEDYLKLPARFIAPLGQYDTSKTPEIKNTTISVEAGSRHEAFAQSFFSGATIVSLATVQDARNAVASGAADYHFGDGLELSFWLQSETSGNCCEFIGGPWLEPGYFDQGMSIATRREDRSTLDAINYGLERLYRNGTYQELYLRYFPLGFY